MKIKINRFELVSERTQYNCICTMLQDCEESRFIEIMQIIFDKNPTYIAKINTHSTGSFSRLMFRMFKDRIKPPSRFCFFFMEIHELLYTYQGSIIKKRIDNKLLC